MIFCAFLFLVASIIVVGHVFPYGEAYHTFMVVLALLLAGLALIRYLGMKHIPKWIWVVNAIAVVVLAFMEQGSLAPEWLIKIIVIAGASIATILAIWTIIWYAEDKKKKNNNHQETDGKPST